MASKKSVLLLDDDKDLCTAMRELLLIFGAASCICCHSVSELKNNVSLPKFDLAILDINLGDNLPNGIDAYDWLIQNNYKGKIVFFSGHAKFNPLVQKALELPNVAFLEKPANINALEGLIK
jgi:DNA-binding NtrC family response regulator